MTPTIAELAASLSKDCEQALRNPVVTVRSDGQWLITVAVSGNLGVQSIGHTMTGLVQR